MPSEVIAWTRSGTPTSSSGDRRVAVPHGSSTSWGSAYTSSAGVDSASRAPLRSRICPRCAGRSIVRTRWSNARSCSSCAWLTCRTTSRTEIAPKANAISANSATSRPAGGRLTWVGRPSLPSPRPLGVRRRRGRSVRSGRLRRARTRRVEDPDVVGETHAVPAGPGGDPTRSGQGGLLAHQLEVILGELLEVAFRLADAERRLGEQDVHDHDAEDHRPHHGRGQQHEPDRAAAARSRAASRRRAAAVRARPAAFAGARGSDAPGHARAVRRSGSSLRAGWLTRHGSVRRRGASRCATSGCSRPRPPSA